MKISLTRNLGCSQPHCIGWFLLFCFFCFHSISLHAQSTQAGNWSIFPGFEYFVQEKVGKDTNGFHIIFERFQKEVGLKGQLNMDTVRSFGNKAIEQAENIDYTEGLVRIYLGFGSYYISKINVDSSKYYYELAIQDATVIRDSQLLAEAYLGYGYALVYDSSDYKGAIQNTQKAYDLGRLLKDTALIIQSANNLVGIYDDAHDILNAYKILSELDQLSFAYKDTSVIVYNLYMQGLLFANLNLVEKQMQTVYKAMEFLPLVKDTSSLYSIYRTIADGYLSTGQYDSVLYYNKINTPIAMSMKSGIKNYTYLAKVYLETQQLDSARFYYEKILDAQQINEWYIDTYEYLDLGRIEFKSGHYKKALYYYKIAESNISKPSLPVQRDIYMALSEYYDALHKYDRSLAYLKKHNTISDSINNSLAALAVFDFESAKYEGQLSLLTKDKEMHVWQFEKQRQQKNMAFLSFVIILLSMVWGFIRFKKQRDLKNKQALLQDRLRISRELHDEVGATLSGIAMYSHVAVEQLRNSKIKEVEHSISSMQKSAGEMIHQLSDIVWLINPEQDTILELFGRLGEYGKQMTRVKNMQMRIDLSPDLSVKHIPLDARRNIYLFCKEAINNAVKYSNGTTLVLQVKSIGQQIIFSVTDDGNGFDESIVKLGNGLVNMQKRAEDIGAEFHVASNMNKGTRLELQYKIIH